MRAVVQRVKHARIFIEGRLHAGIASGFLVLLGIEEKDTEEDLVWLAAKICSMRVFADGDGKMNLDIHQVTGEIAIVSQFTLYASVQKGNRPSFIKAARPDKAIPLYKAFLEETERLLGKPCASGIFGADMQIELLNDGPVTIVLDSKNKE